jgi:hypothetical protein
MSRGRRTAEACLRRVALAIVAAGFVAAAVIFFAAGPEPENPLGYDPMDTKLYLHDLEVYGGTANVLAAEFREWFSGLWHGRNLAGTVVVLSVLAALALRFIAARLPPAEIDASEERVTPFRRRT